jgi:hypothetical protein
MANSTEMKRVHTGEVSYQEQSAAAAVRARLEMDGVSAEKALALKQVRQRAQPGSWRAVLDVACSAAYTLLSLPTFQRSVLPPSSGPWP